MEQWNRLYELADKLKALQPWNILHDYEMFGVRDPGSGTIGFITFAKEDNDDGPMMSVYLGERTLKTLSDYVKNSDTLTPERVWEIAQLSLTFVDHKLVDKNDRDLIKAVGRKYHGKWAWPVFESIRPGMPPWYLDETEMQSMICFLEQAIEVTSRPDIPELFLSPTQDKKKFLVRECKYIGDKHEWEDSFQRIELLPSVKTRCIIPLKLTRELAAIPSSDLVLEIDFFMTPIPVGTPGTRPYFTYFLFAMNQNNEDLIGYKILFPSSGLEAMYESIPATLLELLLKSKIRPKEIHVSSEVLAKLGPNISKKINIPVIRKSNLPGFESAKKRMIEKLSDMEKSISPRYPRNSANHLHS